MKPKVLVVGAGVIGSSLAAELARRGAVVAVVDAAQVCTGTSAATYGWVNANEKTPKHYARLNLLGLRAHERALGWPTRGTWFHQTGSLEVARSTSDLERLEERTTRLARNDYSARMLTTTEVSELEPALRADDIAGGALFAEEGWVDVPTMCTSMLQSALDMGATFHPHHRVTDLTPSGVSAFGEGGITQFKADVVVLAAGNGTRELLASTGVAFPVRDPSGRDGGSKPLGGLICTTSPIDSGIRHMIRTHDVVLRPARNGGVTLADQATGAQWDRTDPAIWSVPNELLARARRLYPALERATTQTVSLGTRVLPDDGLTIADWIDGTGRIYVIATHSGVTLSAHLADVVSKEIVDGKRHGSLKPFGLERFPQKSATPPMA